MTLDPGFRPEPNDHDGIDDPLEDEIEPDVEAVVEAEIKALSRQAARGITRLYLVLAVVLVPWIVYIALSLPRRAVARHYDMAWTGFDIFLLIAIARTAWLAHLRHPAVAITAAVTGALLLVDAWFDVVTASTGHDRFEAIVLAACVEVPLAVLSLAISRAAITRVAHLHQP